MVVGCYAKALKTVLNKAEKGTKEKDPNAPKRGKSAYLYFCNMNRDSARKALGPDAKATDVTSKLGSMWNQLKNDKRSAELSKYEKMAAEDKERYEKDRAGMFLSISVLRRRRLVPSVVSRPIFTSARPSAMRL